jgi:RNA polymerase sigma factor (TIGR02999 family)
MSEVTQILDAIRRGEQKAAAELLPLVYAELRRLAAHKMASENPDQTLQPTALVHEAWLRLTANEQRHWNDRTHFFSAAAEAMRLILVDTARRKRTQRHGGGQHRVEMPEIASAVVESDDKVLAVNEALEKFAVLDPEKAQLVKLRYFVGLTIEQAAEALGISERTAKRYWAFARAWLHEEIKAQQGR